VNQVLRIGELEAWPLADGAADAGSSGLIPVARGQQQLPGGLTCI
jgi:hypothetical protein